MFGGGLAGMAGTATAPGEYVFSEANPFLGDPEAMQKGKDLFRWVGLQGHALRV